MSSNPKFSSITPSDPADAAAPIAAEWVVRRDRGLSPEEAKKFNEWKAADSRHAAELSRIDDAWRKLDAIGAAPGLAAMADAIEVRARKQQASRKILYYSSGLLAAAAAIALAYVGWWQGSDSADQTPMKPGKATYRVLASTAHRLTLPDSSIVELKGDSLIESDFTPTERRVRLMQGEANFSVTKDPSRPFLVSAGPVVVRAVGTAFNVRLASTQVDVLVTEGKIQLEGAMLGVTSIGMGDSLADATLVAGQQARINTSGTNATPVSVVAPTPAEIDETLAWRSTQLIFDQTPLDEVVDAFNHYNVHKLILGTPALRSRSLTGTFRADNLEGFIRLARDSVDVIAERKSDNETLLLPAR